MNHTIGELPERKSVRAFKEQETMEELREQIFPAATAAPTPGNQQIIGI